MKLARRRVRFPVRRRRSSTFSSAARDLKCDYSPRRTSLRWRSMAFRCICSPPHLRSPPPHRVPTLAFWATPKPPAAAASFSPSHSTSPYWWSTSGLLGRWRAMAYRRGEQSWLRPSPRSVKEGSIPPSLGFFSMAKDEDLAWQYMRIPLDLILEATVTNLLTTGEKMCNHTSDVLSRGATASAFLSPRFP